MGRRLDAVGNSYWPPAATEVVISADGVFCDPHSQIFLFSLVLETHLSPPQLPPVVVVPGELLACFVVISHIRTCTFAKEIACLPKPN